MQKSLIIILLLIVNLAFGQKNEDKTDSILSQLKSVMLEKGVSDYFVVQYITYGTAQVYDLNDPNICISKGVDFDMYVVWQDQNETWIRKYDNCGEFNSVKLPDATIFDYYTNNIESIQTDKVEYYKLRPDSIGEDKIYSFRTSRSHSPIRFYWIYQDSIETQKRIDKFHLTTDDKEPNLNYDRNNSLPIAQLNNTIEKTVDSLEKKNSFKRI